MSVEELRELIVPLFSQESGDALERHNQWLSENPGMLLTLNVENIKSQHLSAKNSALLLQREIAMIGEHILSITDAELPEFLLQNLIEILQNPAFSAINKSISTSISRLAKFYIPAGVWASFFDVFFQAFDASSIEIQYDFVDCLNLVLALPSVNPLDLAEKLVSIIEAFIGTEDIKYMTRGIQLLFASVKSKKYYEPFQQFIPTISGILSSGLDITDILHDMCNFVQDGASFFEPDAGNILSLIIQIAASGTDKIKNYATLIISPFIREFSQSITENITEILGVLFGILCEEEVSEESRTQFNPTEDVIKEISNIYDSDVDVGNEIVSFIASLEAGESPQQLRAILVMMRLMWHGLSAFLIGGFADVLYPLIQAAMECEEEEVRYQAFMAARKAIKYTEVEEPVVVEFTGQVLPVVAEESSELVLLGEVKMITVIIEKFRHCTQLIEPIAQAFYPLLEHAPAIVLPVFSTLAQETKGNFTQYCGEILTFVTQVIEGYEEFFQNDNRDVVFKACDTASSISACISAEEFEPVAAILTQFVMQIDPQSLLSAAERDSLNSVFSSLMEMQAVSPSVNEAFDELAEKIFTEASADIKYTEEPENEFEESDGKLALHIKSDGVYRVYEQDEINEAIEAAIALNKLLRTKTKHPEFVERTCEILKKWCSHEISDVLLTKVIKVFASLTKHVDWASPEQYIDCYKTVVESITLIDVENAVETFTNVIPDLVFFVHEFSKRAGPDPSILQNMVEIISETFEMMNEIHEENEDAGNVGETMSNYSLFIEDILGIEYVVLKYHPELAEIVAPLTEMLPLDYPNFSIFSGGIIHVTNLLQTTALLDGNVGEILEALFANTDAAQRKKFMSLHAIFALIITGKLPEEAAANAFEFAGQVFSELGSEPVSNIKSGPLLLSTLFRAADAMQDASPIGGFISILIDRASFDYYWIGESVEVCMQLIAAQKPPFNAPELLKKCVTFITTALEKCNFISEQEAIEEAIQPLLQQ